MTSQGEAYENKQKDHAVDSSKVDYPNMKKLKL